jgi:predicted nucleotide-binding protein
LARKQMQPDDAGKTLASLTIPLADAETQIEQQIQKGEELLQKKEFSQEEILNEFNRDYQLWRDYSEELLRTLFSTEQFVEEFRSHSQRVFNPRSDVIVKLQRAKGALQGQITCLRSIKQRLPLIALQRGSLTQTSTAKKDTEANRRAIFIVHGHHEESKQSVARLIEKLGLHAIILHEQASIGKTIIEKFEHHSDAAFAVILLTPDYVGASQSASDSLNPRARQNVILELGFFIGKLGRENVGILYVPGVELPSDISGLLYIEYDRAGMWRLQLGKEMKAAGLQIDLNDVV